MENRYSFPCTLRSVMGVGVFLCAVQRAAGSNLPLILYFQLREKVDMYDARIMELSQIDAYLEPVQKYSQVKWLIRFDLTASMAF